MSHTRGPWKAHGTNALGLTAVVAPEASFSQGHLVCRVNSAFYQDGQGHEMSLPREQVESNARLIAAAPDLLLACDALLVAIDNGVSMNGDHKCYRAAMVAIAKATGDSDLIRG